MDRTIEHEKLLKKCLLKLSAHGFLCWKNNTGSIKTQNRYQTYGLKGSPDILACGPNGVFCGFEIKTGKAVQNKHQKAFEKQVTKRYGTYLVIRSLKDLEDYLNG